MPSPAEATGYLDVISQLLSFGPLGLVLVMWYFNMMQTREILRRYSGDMAEQRKMYENNIVLVNNFADLAKDLKDIIILNTQVQTRLVDHIENNVFCPAIREAGPKGNA